MDPAAPLPDQPSRPESPGPALEPDPYQGSPRRPPPPANQIRRVSDIDVGHYISSTLQISLWHHYQSDRSFRVHKVIVCAQSPFFDAACGGRFKESSESKIDLPDDDPDMIDRLFQFLYLGNYTDGEYFDELPSIPAMTEPQEVQAQLSQKLERFTVAELSDSANDEDYPSEEDLQSPRDNDEHLEYGSLHSSHDWDRESGDEQYHENCPTQLFTSLRMYVIGDKYDVPALQLLAKTRFLRTAEHHWKTSEEFLAVLDELFVTTSTCDSLRWSVCRLILQDYMSSPNIRELLRPTLARHGDFSMKLLQTVMLEIEKWRPYVPILA
ncbi:hypothetical protein P170DRAFT_514520 [Aspergillus steynii IBT 23096]|uniref:BTB domain-containing protein n=1 Tax=Aspergillus steynii IBT 23096 TaxID=1392250 RepID=A0A2I2FRJ1_9EURO|nr:uncharacterized protein P170DRAFT_514520 [Aspergillus steynii IBT 23096]PLB43255.1 hypothetical protein P170DRAFT_514520 [Aspergillus steynii IBT 23096]